MSTGPLAPGVFVKEQPSGVRTITGAGTSTPAFLGYAVRGPGDHTASPPTLVRSWPEFVDLFHFRSPLPAEAVEEELKRLVKAIDEITELLEPLENSLREEATKDPSPTVPVKAFDQLVTVRTAQWHGQPVDPADEQAAETTAGTVSEAFPDRYEEWNSTGARLLPLCKRQMELTVFQGYFTAAKTYQLAEAVYGFFANGGTSCYVLRLDHAQDLAAQVDGDPVKRTGLAGLKTVPEVTMVAVPDLWSKGADAATGAAVISKVVGHCTTMRNRLALLEPPPGTAPGDVPGFLTKLASPDLPDAEFTTLYYPWVNVPGVDGSPRTVPPSGHIAGIWARTDAERGVFKAPANQNLRGVLTLPTLLTEARHGELNAKGVNCLRVFPDRGLLVWGARTRSSSRDWKYLNVRRLVSFLSDSIRQSTTWAVFEPNDDRLWATLRHSTTSFLTDQWRQGALQGRTPDEAFYVICDTTNNTPATIDKGEVHCDIGIAPVRPAEFVHFTITQIADGPAQSG
ncbi:phage tail sheath family protein [Streptomyces rectiverticillatus]|uniref:phage tail sheath family protein n=1 Tax=Streptomyces rectiverticillatus TaxID=173860 RepID=UPI0015C367ED|nr:phage tail sheath C-terminal domain-containing protein [Streptomyces rectiverticillatus]QLE70506.1 phage tail sheath family protein [Streptomyces rectiverticillatus]